MKYAKQKPIACIMTQSTCYRGSKPQKPFGVLWHSTGANNPYVSRYVQPDDEAENRAEIISVIGKNKNGNDWNHVSIEAGVNAFIGRLANGEVATVQTLPWHMRPWGCGRGKNGSCNTGWVQFEICEDALNDPAYARAVFDEGCELTAYICEIYKIDPWGDKNGVPLVTCHSEAAKFGMASNHADVTHWLPHYGFTMDKIRERVYQIMAEYKSPSPPDKASDWAIDAWQRAYEKGVMDGTNPQADLTREQLAVVLHRLGVI